MKFISRSFACFSAIFFVFFALYVFWNLPPKTEDTVGSVRPKAAFYDSPMPDQRAEKINLFFESWNLGKSYDQTLNLLGIYGGHYLNEQQSTNSVSLNFTVPQDNFSALSRELNDRHHLIDENTQVSQENRSVIQAQERLQRAQEEEKLYEGYLEEAGTLADRLNVEQQLRQIKERIRWILREQETLETRIEQVAVFLEFSRPERQNFGLFFDKYFWIFFGQDTWIFISLLLSFTFYFSLFSLIFLSFTGSLYFLVKYSKKHLLKNSLKKR